MNLNQLREVLAPLAKFASDETSFEVEFGGVRTQVTLRPLLPREDVACQQFAANLLEQAQVEDGLEDSDNMSRAAAIRYFDAFRAEVLSYALVQVGSTDLRSITTIDTGEIKDGIAVRVSKQKAIRDLIQSTWSRAILTICFARYGQLISAINEKADKIAGESVPDLQAEVARVEKRLKRLQDDLERRAKGDPSTVESQIKNLVRAGDLLENEIEEAIEDSRANRKFAEDLPEPPPSAPPVAKLPHEQGAPLVWDEEADRRAAWADQKDEVPEPRAQPIPTVQGPSVILSEARKSLIPDQVPPPTTPPAPYQPDQELEDLHRLEAAQEEVRRGNLEKLRKEAPVQIGWMKDSSGNLLLDKEGNQVPIYAAPRETLSPRRPDRPAPPAPVDSGLNPRFRPPGK